MSSNIQVEKVCEYCRKIFTAKTVKTKYCSHKCNSRAYKANQREAKLQANSLTMKKEASEFDISITKKDFLNVDEAAALLGVSRRTFYRIIDRGEITIKKLGRRTIVRRSEIDTFFELPDIIIPDNKLPDLNDCYTVNEMQERFGISNGALYNLIRRESVPRFTKGKHTYVKKADIERLLMKKIA
mgnify:CR=1 FL=1